MPAGRCNLAQSRLPSTVFWCLADGLANIAASVWLPSSGCLAHSKALLQMSLQCLTEVHSVAELECMLQP